MIAGLVLLSAGAATWAGVSLAVLGMGLLVSAPVAINVAMITREPA